MTSPIIGALLAFLVGAAIAYINYLLSDYVLKKKPEFFPAASILRQILSIGYLVLLYFAAGLTPWNEFTLLIGGALGVTIPMFCFTYKLLKATKSQKSDGNSQKKESDENG